MPVVRSDRSVFTLAGNIVWQGQAERLGKIFGPVYQGLFAERWTAVVDENWTAAWALFDRCGPFASAVDVDLRERNGVVESRMLLDQPKAQELAGLLKKDRVDAVLLCPI